MRKTFFVIALLVMSTLAQAAMPNQITVQGRLTDVYDVPVPSASYRFNFTVYDAYPIGSGNRIWTEEKWVDVTNGLFNTYITNSVGAPFDQAYYLQVNVSGNVLSPRINITSSGYAFYANVSGSLLPGHLDMKNYDVYNARYVNVTDRFFGKSFYDTDNLARYVDPASSTYLATLYVNGVLTMSNYIAMGGNDIDNVRYVNASVLYDKDNVAYYLNPNGNSVLSALTVGGNAVLTTGTTFAGDVGGSYNTLSINSGAVTNPDVANGAVNSSQVTFNYAGSTGKGGAASDISCSGCVDLASEVGGTLPASRGGTGISGAGGTANRVLTTADGSTWSAGQVGLTNMVTGTLPVANGGTGATDAAGARNSLSAAQAGTCTGNQVMQNATSSGVACITPNVADVWVNTSGDTMSGNLNMGGYDVYNVRYVNVTDRFFGKSFYDTDNLARYVDPSTQTHLAKLYLYDALSMSNIIAMGGNDIDNVRYVNASTLYDRDNAAYYVDPSSTSYLTGLSVSTFSCTDCVSLGSQTTGNYLSSVTAGSGISIAGTPGEGWTAIITNTGDLSNTNEIQNIITNKGLQRDASNNFGIMNCADGQIMKYSAGVWSCQVDSGGVGGSGTQNNISKWDVSGTSLTNSIIYDTGTNVGIGTNAPAYKLDVNGAMRLQPTSIPTANNGTMYYNSIDNKFRCYENGAWKDCISSGPLGFKVLDYLIACNGAHCCSPAEVGDAHYTPLKACQDAGYDNGVGYTYGMGVPGGTTCYYADTSDWTWHIYNSVNSKAIMGIVCWSVTGSSGGGSGTPGGTSGQVQFNNGGTFGGASSLYYDNAASRVGVGTSSPNARLEINSAPSNGLSFNASNDLFVNDSSNRVGIGTANPSEALDVAGNINIGSSSAYKRGGTSGITLATACGSSQYLESIKVDGGIITAGTCKDDATGSGGPTVSIMRNVNTTAIFFTSSSWISLRNVTAPDILYAFSQCLWAAGSDVINADSLIWYTDGTNSPGGTLIVNGGAGTCGQQSPYGSSGCTGYSFADSFGNAVPLPDGKVLDHVEFRAKRVSGSCSSTHLDNTTMLGWVLA